MKKPLLWKASLSYLLMAVVLIGIFSVFMFSNQIDIINENSLNKIKIYSLSIRDSISGVTDESEGIDLIEKKLKEFSIKEYAVFEEETNSYILLKNINKTTDLATDIEMITLSISKVSNSSSPFSFSIVDKVITAYVPVVINNKIFVIKLLSEFRDSYERLNQMYISSIVAAVVTLVLHIVFAGFFYLFIFRRLGRIEFAFGEIIKGNYDYRITDKRNDEISKIAEGINFLAPKVGDAILEARSSNPLSGLPGNISIKKEINRRIALGKYFAVIYIDIDNFKAYNDKYGFQKGDEGILYTSDILKDLYREQMVANELIFVGHVGGDDLVAICNYYKWEELVRFIKNRFDDNIKSLYNDEDNAQGFIESKDRDGNKKTFKLMSLSMTIVSNKYKTVTSDVELLDSSGEIKKKIKNLPNRVGSAYLEDTRGDN